MKCIPNLLLPYTEIESLPLGDGYQEHRENFVEACWECGCPYMILTHELIKPSEYAKRRGQEELEKPLLGRIDIGIYCAKCGKSQGGVFIDNDNGTSKRYPPE